MGKIRRSRSKFHTSSNKSTIPDTSKDEIDQSMDSLNTTPMNFAIPDDLFSNIKINLNDIKKSLNDDTQSVKSFKSMKSEASGDKALSKKEKLKLRKNMLLQKIDTLNQQKKEAQKRNKRKKQVVIGDTNPLLDALPSLESLMSKKKTQPVAKSTKGIQKATKRKKETLKNIQLYKFITKNKDFNENPLDAVTQHVRAVVADEKLKKDMKKN